MPVRSMASTLTGQLDGCRDAAHPPGRRAPGARRRLAPAGGREPVRRPERENGDRAGPNHFVMVPSPLRVCTVALGAYISALVLPLQ